MTKIVLTRHGHVEGIKPERFRGREPLQLTARGVAEAAALAQYIAGRWRPSHIYNQSDEPLHRNGRSDRASDRRYRQNLRGSQRYRLRCVAI